jgi:hypothetical protein
VSWGYLDLKLADFLADLFQLTANPAMFWSIQSGPGSLGLELAADF